MSTDAPASPGILGSLRSMADGLIETVHDRLELLGIELHEEKFRLIQIFIWISAAIFTGMLGIMFASLTLVYIFWESARLAVLGGLAAFYLIAFGAIIMAFRRYLARMPRPFSASLSELKHDRACIQPES